MTTLRYRGISYQMQSTSIHTVPTSKILKFMGVAYEQHVYLQSVRKLPSNLVYRGIHTNPQASVTPQEPALPGEVQPNLG